MDIERALKLKPGDTVHCPSDGGKSAREMEQKAAGLTRRAEIIREVLNVHL